jgi:hypothetical protein
MVNVSLRDRNNPDSSSYGTRRRSGTLLHALIWSIALGLTLGAGTIFWMTRSRPEPEVAAVDVHPVIGETALTVSSDLIRFAAARQDGPIDRLDLLFAWPALTPADEMAAATLRASGAVDPLIFVTVSADSGAPDSTERLDSVYSRVFSDEAWAGPAGLVGVALSAEAGYAGEELFFEPEGDRPFVVRCLASNDAAIAETCMREVDIGSGLTVLYRFDKSLLSEWRTLEAAIRARIEGLVTTEQTLSP